MAGSRVFISYAFVNEQHPDYLFVQRFAKDLRQAGVDVIVDTAYLEEQAFVQWLNRVLPDCQWVIVIQSPDALRSLRVQMTVNTALQLVTQQRMQKVLAVIAMPYDVKELPLTWESLTVIDATQDYMKALARVLLDLDLKEVPVNTSALLSSNSSPTLQNDVIWNAEDIPFRPPSGNLAFSATSKQSSLEDRPVASPFSVTSLMREPVTAASPKEQKNSTAVASSERWSPPKSAGWSPESRQTGKRPKILLIALVIAALIVIGSTVIFYFSANNSNRQSFAYGKTATSGASVSGVSTSTTTAKIPSPSISVTTTTSTPTAMHNSTVTTIPAATPMPGSTIHLTQCGNNLVTPWVALYQYSQFGGRQICFTGVGFINLATYGFDKQTMAINIAANGVFFDQPDGNGNQLAFYYGDERSDLGSWDNRISSFRVDSSNPAPVPTPTKTPTLTPSPTSKPGSTIHLTQCGNNLVAPWVALYQYSQFGGQQICFSGVGLINLSDYGFDKQTMAINIAANGAFFDQADGNGNQLGFYYGDEQSDLGSWDNRISSFRVDS